MSSRAVPGHIASPKDETPAALKDMKYQETSIETPGMAKLRLQHEQRRALTGGVPKPTYEPPLELGSTLVTQTMSSAQEEVALEKLGHCISGEGKRVGTTPGYNNLVGKTLTYDHTKAPQPRRKKVYKQVKPYFQY